MFDYDDWLATELDQNAREDDSDDDGAYDRWVENYLAWEDDR